MHFEPEKPARRGLAALGDLGEDLVLGNPLIVTDGQSGRIQKGDAGATAHAIAQIGAQWHQNRWNEFDKARVTDQTRKFSLEMGHYFLRIKRFEIAIMRLVKQNQNRHDFTPSQTSHAVSLAQATFQQVRLEWRYEGLAEIIDLTEQFK